MTRRGTCQAIVILAAGIAIAACGKSDQANQQQASTSGAAAAPAPAAPQAAEITFKSDPDPVKTGDNTFEVMVMQDGKPVDDASVSAEFYMAPMPAMKMPEMRMKTDLAPAGNGMYRGKGQVMMAGNWDVTVMAMRGGQELGTKKLTVTAK